MSTHQVAVTKYQLSYKCLAIPRPGCKTESALCRPDQVVKCFRLMSHTRDVHGPGLGHASVKKKSPSPTEARQALEAKAQARPIKPIYFASGTIFYILKKKNVM